ncbi:MAG: amidohydrolase family protein [Desulfosporosinus sp.]|nr:amidohydrolase family protein [Desulfosporosinus sp.]
MNVDLLIKNGFIIDGTGNPGFYGDLAVNEGKIIEVATKIECEAARVINASGLTVSPGFIDPHVHAELAVLTSGKFEGFLRQGVTTTVNGNCGHSITPYSSDNIYAYMAQKGLISVEAKERNQRLVPAWANFSGYIDIIKNKGTNLNMGFLLGHGTLRWSLMGDAKNSQPTVEEVRKMSYLIEEGMEQGALGISTGLAYAPSKYADTAEIIKLAEITKKYDGIYTSHLRTHLGITEAVNEAIRIGEASGIRVQISHLTPTIPEAFDEILTARERGVEIAVDTIPKTSGHFKRKDRLLQFIGLTSEALKTPEGKRRILKKIRFKDHLLVINTDDPQMENRTLKEIAQERKLDVDQLFLNLLESDNPNLTFCQGGLIRRDFPGIPYANNIAHHPLVMVGSDRVFGEIDDPLDWYELFRKGAFPIFFDLCRQKGVRLEEIIRRLTSLPAEQFRLSDRGMLAKGKAADITVIDMGHYSYPSNEEINYKNSSTMASGVKYTIVNGKVALDDGMLKEVYSGQLLSMYGRNL